jgi:MscS family membrane protein
MDNLSMMVRAIEILPEIWEFWIWQRRAYLLKENQNETSSTSARSCLAIALGFFSFLLLCLSGNLQAQTRTTPPAAKTETSAVVDPLGRETPRGAVMGILKYEELGDFENVARYLQPPLEQNVDLVDLARQARALRHTFNGNIALLSDDPEGQIQAGLPPGQVRIGGFVVGGTTVDVILVRVEDPKFGKIWLVSRETVAKIPNLYADLQREKPSAFNRIVPATLANHSLFGMSFAQWLGWLLSIPASMSLAWLLTLVLSASRRVWYGLRRLPFTAVWATSLDLPLSCIVAIFIHCFFVYLLDPPLLYRVYYFRFMSVLLVACFAWLVSRIIDRGFDSAVHRTRAQHSGGESILILMQRLTRVVMVMIVFVAALALFGINVKTTLAGLGIGGLALALAAQKTFENIFGGVTLLMDKAVQVGDFCAIGGKLGTVEDIGLRSLKLRTLDQNLLNVPNGALAQMQFENMKARPKLLIDQMFLLRIETPVEQVRKVLNCVQRMLDGHPSVEAGSRIRVNDFAGAAFELELFAYVNTGDWVEFTAIRQEVILKVAEIVEQSGAQIAAPTRLTYLSSEKENAAEKATGVGIG